MPLTKRAALKCLARTAFVNAAMTARGMQQIGLSYVLAPALRCLYTDPVTLGQAFARYAGHSNTHVFMLPAYTGLLLSMEEQIAGGVLPASVLTSLRTTLATTLSALGDAFFSGSMRTFWALTCVCLLLEGNIWPAAIFTLILLSILQIFRVVSFFFCLTHGIAHVGRAHENLQCAAHLPHALDNAGCRPLRLVSAHTGSHCGLCPPGSPGRGTAARPAAHYLDTRSRPALSDKPGRPERLRPRLFTLTAAATHAA